MVNNAGTESLLDKIASFGKNIFFGQPAGSLAFTENQTPIYTHSSDQAHTTKWTSRLINNHNYYIENDGKKVRGFLYLNLLTKSPVVRRIELGLPIDELQLPQGTETVEDLLPINSIGINVIERDNKLAEVYIAGTLIYQNKELYEKKVA